MLALPLDFEVNGKPAGEITVEADPSLQIIAIDMAGLKGKLQSLEDIEYNKSALENFPDEYVPLADIQANGIDIALDFERLVISFTAEKSKSVDRSNRQSIRFGYQATIERDDHHVDEAHLSAYANFNIRSTRLKNELGIVTDYQRMAIEHVFNYKGIALEGVSAWSSQSQYQLNRIRLVKDLPGKLQRVVFGDLSTPIKNPQRGFQLWGASLFKEFDLQPYRTFTPTSSATFELDENATVQMEMNGRPSRTMKLSPGVYDIEQFKLAAGLNTMDLEIVTDSGSVERIQVNSFGEPTLLDKGVATYALSIGLPSANSNDSDAFVLSDASWYSRRLSPKPILSGYYQKGLTDQLTANINLQANESWSRLGAESTWVNTMGSYNINLGLNSTAEYRSATRIGGDWKRNLNGYQLAISGYYATDGFERVFANGKRQDRSLQNSFSLRVGKRFGDRASAILGILHQKRRFTKSEQSIAFNFGYKFP